MQKIAQKPALGRLQLPAVAGNAAVEGSPGTRSNRVAATPSPWPRSSCSYRNNRPPSGSVNKCSRHGHRAVNGEKAGRRPHHHHHHGNKEVIKRALTPPNRRLTLRWLNFRPTPSRLSNVSAE